MCLVCAHSSSANSCFGESILGCAELHKVHNEMVSLAPFWRPAEDGRGKLEGRHLSLVLHKGRALDDPKLHKMKHAINITDLLLR